MQNLDLQTKLNIIFNIWNSANDHHKGTINGTYKQTKMCF